MSHRCLQPLAAIAAIVYLSIPSRAQPGEIALIRGELQSESPVDFHQYRIELEDLNRHSDVYRADLRLNGAFDFRRIPAGAYLLRVTDSLGFAVHQEFVTVNPSMPSLTVQLPRSLKTPSAPGTISVTQLRHPPDRKAIQSFTAAQRFAAAGSPEKAAAELEKAVRISPEFADAYTNLGVQHIRMGRYEEAAGEFSRAIAIAGPSALMLSNLAFTQINLGRVAESVATLRAALHLDSAYPPAHLILGGILAGDPARREEAIAHLERVVETFPSARPTLERLRAPRPN